MTIQWRSGRIIQTKNVGNVLRTGLGLVRVKNCVDIQQGKIFVISTLGVDITFTFILPLNH